MSGDMKIPASTTNGQASCPVPQHVLAFIGDLRTAISPILPTPPVRRKRGELQPNFMPRSSGQIAMHDKGLDSETKAKRVLLRRLGLLQEEEPVSSDVLA